MEKGKRIGTWPSLEQSRTYATAQLASLPDEVRQLREGITVEVLVSQALRDLAQAVDAQR